MEHERIHFNARASPIYYGGVIYQFSERHPRRFSAVDGRELY